MDFDTRQQLLAEQLRRYQGQAQTQAPEGRMVGRRYVAPHALEYLAAGLRGAGGMRGEQQTQSAMGDLANERQTAMVSALKGFGQDMQGQPAREVGANEMDPQGYTAPAVPANPMAAYERLTGSGVPELQKVGMQGMGQYAQDQQKIAADLAGKDRERLAKEAAQQRVMQALQGAQTPQAALAAGVPPELVKTYFDQGLGKTKPTFVNGMPVDPYTAKPVGAAIPPQVNMASDLLIPDPANPGRMIPNQALIGVKGGLAEKGASRVNVDSRNYNTQESEQSKVYGKSLGESRAAINQAGYDAPAKLARLDRMEQLLAGVDGGAAAPAMADIASFANSLGVKIDPKLGNKQAAEALAREMAATLRQPGTGPMTDKDFENFLKQVPSLSKTAEGRTEIVKTLRASIDRDLRASKFARDYAGKNGGVIDDNFFDSLAGFYAQNPVVTPSMPAANSRGQAFDPDKEKRYQEYVKRQGGK